VRRHRSLRGLGIVLVGASLTLACNALVGFGALERVDGPDDPEREGGTGQSGSSSGQNGDGGGSNDQDGGADSGVTTPRCDVTKAFGAPQLVTEFDGAENASRARLTPDELEAFFVKGPTNAKILRHAKRTAIGAPWTVSTVAITPAISVVLSVTVNGLKLYYYAQGGQFSVTTRTDRQTAFGMGKALNEDPQSDFLTTVVESDDISYYSRIKPGGGTEIEIVRAPLLVSGVSTGTVEVVPNLDHPGMDDWDPVLTPNQLAIYYSVGPDSPSVQQWVARRTATGQTPFGPPVRVPELEDAANDHISWVSNDECVVYLNRSTHVSMAQRPPK
jgi:hypothetical protein